MTHFLGCDASSPLYRWNGLEEPLSQWELDLFRRFRRLDAGSHSLSAHRTMRASRACCQQELDSCGDLVNLPTRTSPSLHNLAINVRNLELFYAQYNRYQEVRKAAQENLDQQVQIGNELEGFIVLLQAIVDWGNAVANEAQALVLYNSELAALERETGTILETHGITFVEERFGTIGPLGRLARPVAYPAATPTTGYVDRYEGGEAASDSSLTFKTR